MKMNRIILSVIIPCYNDGKYLLEAIESVRKYKRKDYEIIIINDGSTDKNTIGVLKHLKKEGCLVIDQKHKGPSSARNNGIKRAKGKYLLLLDSDNKIEPKYIREGVKILEGNPDVGVVYSDVKIFGEEEKVKKIIDFDFSTLLQYNYIDTCTVLRKDVWEDVGGFDVKLDKYTWEDWVFWIGVAKKGWKFYHIPEVLFYYRIRKDSRNKMADDYSMRERLFNFIAKKYGSNIYEEYRKLFSERDYLKSVLNDKDNQINEYQKVIGEKDNQIKGYKKVVDDKDNQIKGYKKVVDDKDNQISKLDERLSDKDNQLQDHQKIINDKENKISSLNEMLLSIKNSLTWRSVQKFDWIIRPLLIDSGILREKVLSKGEIYGVGEEIGKVSIILPSYNYAWSINEAIDSVINQDYKNWELIIVDDGSSDDSVEVIEEYVKKYPDNIKLFFHESRVNKGLAETYKLGLSKCDGEFVAFIEADDIWHLDYLSSKIPIFEKYDDVVLVYNNVEMFGSEKVIRQNRDSIKFLLEDFKMKNKPFYAMNLLMERNIIPSFSCFVVRKDAMRNLNLTSKPAVWLDWWLLFQISLKGKFYYQYDKKTKWRMHEKSYNVGHQEIRGAVGLNRDVMKMKKRIVDYTGFYVNKERGNLDSKSFKIFKKNH